MIRCCMRTVEIAESLGVLVAQGKRKNYANQFQWGLDSCAEYCGESGRGMCMDAHGHIEPGRLMGINSMFLQLEDGVTGVYFHISDSGTLLIHAKKLLIHDYVVLVS